MVAKCLILSCENYQHHPKLKGAGRDGTIFKDVLVENGIAETEIMHLPDFSREQVFHAAQSWVNSIEDSPRWLLLLVACHGYEQDGHVFLRPSDSMRDEDDFCLQHLTNAMPTTSGLVAFLATCRERSSNAARPFNPTRLQRRLNKSHNHGPEEFMMFPCRSGDVLEDSSSFVSALVDQFRIGGLNLNLHSLAAAIQAKLPRCEVVSKLRTMDPKVSVLLGLDPNTLDVRTFDSTAATGRVPVAAVAAINSGTYPADEEIINMHDDSVGAIDPMCCSWAADVTGSAYNDAPDKWSSAEALSGKSKSCFWTELRVRECLSCLFIQLMSFHFVLIALWFCGVVKVQWNTRVSFNLMLVSLYWASLNHACQDIQISRARLVHLCASNWQQVQCHAFWIWFLGAKVWRPQ